MAYAFPVCSSFIDHLNFFNKVFLMKWYKLMLLFDTFQHDELKPLTRSFTDSLSELGNLNVLKY
jgi:hypothetical protein